MKKWNRIAILAPLVVMSHVFASTGLVLSLDRRDTSSVYPLAFTLWVKGHLTGTATDGLAGFSFDLEGALVDLSSGEEVVFDVSSASVVPAVASQMDAFVNDATNHRGLNNPDGFGGSAGGADRVQIGGAQDTLGNAAALVHPFPKGPVVENVAKAGFAVLAKVSLTIPAPPTDHKYVIRVKDFYGSVLDASQNGPTYLCTELDPVAIVSIDAVPNGACCAGTVCLTRPAPECIQGESFKCDVAEFLPETFIGCYGDVDGNGTINAGERGFVSANIGQTDADKVCLYDMDGNGFINAGDRGFVSVNIGLCTTLPDWQNGSGMNHGVPDTRFANLTFHAGSTCPTMCP